MQKNSENNPLHKQGGQKDVQQEIAELKKEMASQSKALMAALAQMNGTLSQVKKELDKKTDTDDLKQVVERIDERYKALVEEMSEDHQKLGDAVGRMAGSTQSHAVSETNRLWKAVSELMVEIEARDAQRNAKHKQDISWQLDRFEDKMDRKF